MIKSFLKSLLPRRIVRWRYEQVAKRRWAEYEGLSTEQVFTKIYADGVWGTTGDSSQPFFSGSGSHEGPIVEEHISAVRNFLANLPAKPDVVDLGCGDFHVGAQLRPLCNRYIACDIVAPLIEFNRNKYNELDVDFRVLDLSQDALPAGDIVFIRQVLQHLSNAHISRALTNLASFRTLIVSEHVPKGANFVPNLDKPAGADIRLGLASGVVLTKPPFNLPVKTERVLCEVLEFDGVIRTLLYTM